MTDVVVAASKPLSLFCHGGSGVTCVWSLKEEEEDHDIGRVKLDKMGKNRQEQ